MSEAWIIDACRTPRGIGKVGKGALADLHPQLLGSTVLKAIAERNDLNTDDVDDVIWGTSMQGGTQGGDLGRMAALDAGFSMKSSGMTLDRFCGSGITTANLATANIMSGLEDVVIAGGTEMMSCYAANRNAGYFIDSGNEHLRAIFPQPNQGVAADAIAALEGISRQSLDELGALSQERAAVAIAEGRFEKSLIAVSGPDGTMLLDHEEYPRPTSTYEKLATLEPSFGAIADIVLDDKGTTFRNMVHQRFPGLEFETLLVLLTVLQQFS